MKYSLMIAVIFTFGLMIPFQNCSDVTFDAAPAESVESTVPDVVTTSNIPADEEEIICTEGKTLGIWGDSNNNQIKEDSEYLGEITSYKGDLTAEENYNYYSASAHPIEGPTPDSFSSHVFFYDGTDGLTFNFYFNVDAGGSNDNTIRWKVYTDSNKSLDDVLFIDDPNSAADVIEVTQNTVDKGKQYDVSLRYWSNTDGAIIGPFQGEDFTIQVDMLDRGDNQEAAFYSSNGSKFDFIDSKKEIKTFFISYKGYKNCK